MREVIANLTKDFGNSSSPMFGEVMITGRKVRISSLVINEYYNSLVEQHVEPELDFNKIARCITVKRRLIG